MYLYRYGDTYIYMYIYLDIYIQKDMLFMGPGSGPGPGPGPAGGPVYVLVGITIPIQIHEDIYVICPKMFQTLANFRFHEWRNSRFRGVDSPYRWM